MTGVQTAHAFVLGFPPYFPVYTLKKMAWAWLKVPLPKSMPKPSPPAWIFEAKYFTSLLFRIPAWFCRVKDVGWSHSGASYFCLKADRPMIHFPPTPSMCERSYCCVCAAGWDLCIGATCIQFVTFCPNRLVDIGNEDHTERDRAALYLFLILLRMHSDADLNKSSLTHSFKSLVLRSILTQYL